jgi:hypothetical protein
MRGCKMKMRLIYIGIIITFFTSCTRTLEPEKYMQWLNDKKNLLIVEREKSDFIFSAQYKTPEYMTLVDQGTEIRRELFDKKLQEFRGLEYYSIRIGSGDRSSDAMKYKTNGEDMYLKRLSYFTSGIEKDIRLACGKDTFTCSVFLFERSYKMASYESFLVAFDTKNAPLDQSGRVLIVNPKNLGTGQVELPISQKPIRNIPKLKLT